MSLRPSDRKTAVNTSLKCNHGSCIVAKKLVRSLFFGLVLFPGLVLAISIHAEEPQTYQINLPYQSVAESLVDLSKQIDVLLLFSYDIANTLSANPVNGNYTLLQTLEIMLEGTGFFGGLSEKGVLMISLVESENIQGNKKTEEKEAMKTGESRRSGNVITTLSVAALTALGAQPSVATADADNSARFLEEVVVTARKRAEGLQDIPVSISVLSAERLEHAGIESIDQATALLPSFTFSNGVEPRNASVRLRGIGTQSFSLAVEPSVSTVIDGIVTGRPGAALEDIADIDRIEVLRGPQGTLFGKNASAGAINIITKGPNQEKFEGYVRAGIAEDGEYRAKSAITGPISDRFSYRLNSFYREIDGVARNINTGESVGGIDSSWGIRGKLRYDTGENFDVTLTMDIAEKDSECCVRAERIIFTDNSFLERSGTPIGRENINVSEDSNVFSDTKNLGLALEANWELSSGHVLTYIGGYRNWKNTANLDNDSTRFNFIPRQGGTTDSDVITQELRIASPVGELFDYVAGLYYFNHDADRRFMDIGCRLNELDETTFDFDKGLITGCSLAAGTEGSGNWVGSVENENYAAFAHANFHVTEQLTLLAGLRVLHEKLSFDFRRNNPVTGNLGGRLVGSFDASESTSDTATIWKLGVQYQWTDDLMTYLTAATGYKGRAYNISQPLSAATLAREPLDPEESDSIELGMKSSWFEQRLIVNVAVFTTDIDGFQTNGRDPVSEVNIFRNAATVRTRGVEVDFSAAAGENLTLYGGVTFLDATFKDFAGAPCYPGQTAELGCVGVGRMRFQDLTGASFNNAPDTKITLSAKWDFALGDWSGYLQPTYVWQDDVIFNFNQDPNRAQSSYGLLNAQLGFVSPTGKVEVSLYGRNLTDKFYATDIFKNVGTVGSGNGYYHTFARDVQRYFGANVKFNF